MTPQTDINQASPRRWLYGFNLWILVALGMTVFVLLMVVTERTKGQTQWDWSSNGINSLSGSSQRLMQQINNKKQTYQIYSLFSEPSPQDKDNGDPGKQAEKRRQVNDLLALYARGSGYIQVDDWGDRSTDDLGAKIRDKYQEQLKPYEETAEGFNALAKKVEDFATSEADRAAVNIQRSGKKEDAQLAGEVQASFRKISSSLEDSQRDIGNRMNHTLPDWSDLTDTITRATAGMQAFFESLADPAKLKGNMPPAGVQYFTEASERYKGILLQVQAYQQKLSALKPLKIQDVLSAFSSKSLINTIIVLGPDSAKIFQRYDIYVPQQTPQGSSQQPPLTFKGEELVSSALLAMVQPEKVKVVFVTPSPQRVTQDLYSNMADILQANNFDVMEWAPPSPQPNPEQPPSSPEPPAQGKGVVWVVLKPNPMEPESPQLIAAVQNHMNAGGQTMFLAQAATPNPEAPTQEGYAFDSLIKPFGIEVRANLKAVEVQEGEDPDTGEHVTQFTPGIAIERFEDHEITAPLQSYTTIFYPASYPHNLVTVVDVDKNMPKGVQATVIARTPATPDYWATTDASEPKFKNTDIAGPIPLAAVAIKNKGQPNEQRIAVFATPYLATNQVLTYPQTVLMGDRLVTVPRFPGNQELMRNSILWLAGYENMIAVSSRSNPTVRIGNVSPAALFWIRCLVLAIAPILALAAGGLVWFARRR